LLHSVCIVPHSTRGIMMHLAENLSEEATRKWPMGNRMVTWPMMSRDPERSLSLVMSLTPKCNISKTAGDRGLVQGPP